MQEVRGWYEPGLDNDITPIEGDEIKATFGETAIAIWQDWKRYGMGGGWLKQPLSLLAQTNMIDFVNATYKYKTAEGSDWSKLSRSQQELVRWLDNG